MIQNDEINTSVVDNIAGSRMDSILLEEANARNGSRKWWDNIARQMFRCSWRRGPYSHRMPLQGTQTQPTRDEIPEREQPQISEWRCCMILDCSMFRPSPTHPIAWISLSSGGTQGWKCVRDVRSESCKAVRPIFCNTYKTTIRI